VLRYSHGLHARAGPEKRKKKGKKEKADVRHLASRTSNWPSPIPVVLLTYQKVVERKGKKKKARHRAAAERQAEDEAVSTKQRRSTEGKEEERGEGDSVPPPPVTVADQSVCVTPVGWRGGGGREEEGKGPLPSFAVSFLTGTLTSRLTVKKGGGEKKKKKKDGAYRPRSRRGAGRWLMSLSRDGKVAPRTRRGNCGKEKKKKSPMARHGRFPFTHIHTDDS